MRGDIIDYGSVPAWFAFLAAAVAAFFAARNLRIAAQTRRDDVNDKRREQASTIAAWLTGTTEPGSYAVNVLTSNRSGVPVYEATLYWRMDERVGKLLYCPTLSPAIEEGRELRRATEVINQNEFDDVPWLSVIRESGALVLAISFRDSSNRWWYRDFDGMLHEGKYQPRVTVADD